MTSTTSVTTAPAATSTTPPAEVCVATMEPIYQFTVKDFEERHGKGSEIEFRNEGALITKFNQSRYKFNGVFVCELVTKATFRGRKHDILAFIEAPTESDMPYPAIGDICEVAFEEKVTVQNGTLSLGFLPAERIENTCEALGYPQFAKHAAFRVTVPHGVDNNDNDALGHAVQQLMGQTKEGEEPELIVSSAKKMSFIFRLIDSTGTFEAEMNALHRLLKEENSRYSGYDERRASTFRYLLDFKKDSTKTVNVLDAIPHMKNPTMASNLPAGLVTHFRRFNPDHKAAYEQLASVPHGVHFVGGGPGAGKTTWNLVTAASAFSKPIQVDDGNGSLKSESIKILYLVDMNGPVTDVANRMIKLCAELGLDKRVVRMHSLPKEIRLGGWDHKRQASNASTSTSTDDVPDYTRSFLKAGQLANLARPGTAEVVSAAPSLDTLAWEHYRNSPEAYKNLTMALEKYERQGMTKSESMALRRMVEQVFKAVIESVDFIATTPVAAANGKFKDWYKPHLVFLDEAPHARELTLMIPIAFFEPLAWIFTGDYHQTRPFVATPTTACRDGHVNNPYAEQLKISTMERADKCGALSNWLLINHRAHARLESMASSLFYGGKMRSAHPTGQEPKSVLYLRKHMSDMIRGQMVLENRLLVVLDKANEVKNGTSFVNRKHLEWVVNKVKQLAADPDFKDLSGQEPGKMLIISPYKAQVSAYRVEVRRLPRETQERVEVRTVDVAQGHESDVVFLDLVRSTGPGFCDDANRLNVATTRAQQGEFILMQPRMTRVKTDDKLVPTKNLMGVWEHCQRAGRCFKESNGSRPALRQPRMDTWFLKPTLISSRV